MRKAQKKERRRKCFSTPNRNQMILFFLPFDGLTMLTKVSILVLFFCCNEEENGKFFCLRRKKTFFFPSTHLSRVCMCVCVKALEMSCDEKNHVEKINKQFSFSFFFFFFGTIRFFLFFSVVVVVFWWRPKSEGRRKVGEKFFVCAGWKRKT